MAKLQEYCQEHSDHNVIYLHSKGTFHANDANNRLRNLITLAALSDECYVGLNNTTCNVCSVRFSPIPHWHTPGNMWTAKCSYVEKLYPILDFDAAVTEIAAHYLTNCSFCPDFSVGSGRYANEHWVHTHPQVNPCDVYTDLEFVAGYPSLGDVLPPFSLSNAPRTFPGLQSMDFMTGPQVRLTYRLYEMEQLFNATPTNDSFVWNWYQQENIV